MKKILVLSLFIFSCNLDLSRNNNIKASESGNSGSIDFGAKPNLESKELDISKNETTENKEKITDTNIKNRFSSNYIKSMLDLKNFFLNNTKGKIRATHIDDDNNTVIIFDDIMYYINNNGYIKTYDLKDKLYNKYNAVLYLDKGNGFGFFNPETVDNSNKSYIVDFKSFEPQDNINSSNIQTSLLSIDSNKNGIGYSLTNDSKTINFYDINDSLKLIPLNKIFTLNNNERFYQNNIFNKGKKGFIFSEETIDGKIKNKMYLLENNQIDINKAININFKNIDHPDYINGKIDDNGNGFLYGQKINTDINKYDLELKKISNYKLEDNSYLFKDIKNPNIFINNNGNGVITSGVDQKTMYLYSINNYSVIKLDKISSDIFSSIRTSINDNGNGFIVLTYYKNSNISQLPFSYYSDIILVENYQIVEDFLK